MSTVQPPESDAFTVVELVQPWEETPFVAGYMTIRATGWDFRRTCEQARAWSTYLGIPVTIVG